MMASTKRTVSLAALAMLAIVCHAAIGVNSDHGAAKAYAIKVNMNGDDTASIPDFDGDGTIGFGDFVKFAAKFGLSQGDVGYDAQFDLNDDGEIGFADLLIFAENFGKDAPSPAVAIPDANLRAAIEVALGKATGAPITEAEMATLDSLAASDAEITDLTGINYAANLAYLSLNDNNITDVSSLARLTRLTRLWLSNNSIEDVSSLSKLTNLTELWLWNNRIEDISPLSGLTKLTRLSLGRNKITDVSALSGLTKLKTLILTGNDISDLAPLVANEGLGAGAAVDVTDNPLNPASHSTHVPALQARGVRVSFVPSPVVRIPDANLRAAIEADLGKERGATITAAEMATLDVFVAGDVEITDLTGLEYATNLAELNLWGNNITDVSPLSGLTNLADLHLGSNNISDVSPLVGLTNLTWLSLGSNNVSDASPLSGLTSLTALFLSFNNVSDLSPLSGLTNLTDLYLRGNNVSELSPLSGLANLTGLYLWSNSISDVSPLSGLTNLTKLELNGNNIQDVSPLSGLTNLTWLQLWNNNIQDASPLSGLTNLTHLLIDGNDVSDVSPLSVLTKLTSLFLRGNNVSDLSPLSGLAKLTSLGLDENKISDLSPLSGLTNLTRLGLRDNRIADLSPLVANSGLAQGDEVDVRGNPLSASSYSTHVPALQRRGVDVLFDPDPENVAEYDAPTLVAQHDDRVVVMGVPGRLRTDPIDFEALAQAFFTHYEDAFDYLMVLSNLPEHGNNQHYTYAGIHLSVRNAVEGTGKSRYSKNEALGSAGRLNAILHFPWNQALLSGPSLHEILHSWANYAIPTAAGGHWGFSSANGQLGGFDRANLVDHGGGRYSAGDFGLVANGGNSVPYSPIELYFAGLIPPSEVPELWVAEDGTGLKDASGNWVYDDAGYQIFTASKVSTWSIERIVAEHGARVPDSSQSQKEFRAALILAVDPLHPARKSTLDELSAAVQRFTHAGSDDYNFNFWEATGGRATLTMDGLSAYRRSGAAGKRAASYRVVEPEANQDGSIGCIRMDDVVWAGQWMVSPPENDNR